VADEAGIESTTPGLENVDALAAQLQGEGAKAFVRSWEELMAVIDSKISALRDSLKPALPIQGQ
jgi:hypothetical protein